MTTQSDRGLREDRSDEQVRDYILSLKVGERVIETGKSMMTGAVGTVYISDNEGTRGSICVKWEWPKAIAGMGTSVTHGTRRISEVLSAYTRPIPVTAEVSEEQQSFLIQLATNERDRCLRHYQGSVECYADYSEGKMAANFIGCTFSPRDRLRNDKGAYELAESSLSALSAALKAQKGVGTDIGWTRCIDRLPKVGEQVMAHHVDGDSYRAYMQRDGSWVNCTANTLHASEHIHTEAYDITHWRPLLPTPNESQT